MCLRSFDFLSSLLLVVEKQHLYTCVYIRCKCPISYSHHPVSKKTVIVFPSSLPDQIMFSNQGSQRQVLLFLWLSTLITT